MRSQMRVFVVTIAVLASLAAGCGRPHGGPADVAPHHGDATPPFMHDLNSFAMFGASNINIVAVPCAARAQLQQGSAVVKDKCFTGDTNVVLCTDVSAPNPVMCAPHAGELAIAGAANDTVSWARIR